VSNQGAYVTGRHHHALGRLEHLEYNGLGISFFDSQFWRLSGFCRCKMFQKFCFHTVATFWRGTVLLVSPKSDDHHCLESRRVLLDKRFPDWA
jgi:hypothetical protein